MACGQTQPASTYGSSSYSSRGLTTTNTNYTTIAGASMALCSGFDYESKSMAGLVSTYIDPNTGATDLNQVRLRITNLPTNFINASSTKIEFHLWHEQTRNNIVHAPSATGFKIQHKGSGYYVANLGDSYSLVTSSTQATTFTEMNSGLLKSIQSDINESISGFYGSDLADFFDGTIFILQNVSISYQAVSMAQYPLSGGDSIESAEFIIPPFYANPNAYQQTHDSLNLLLLHPNYDIRSSGLTDDEYYQQTNTFCNEML